MMRRRYLAPWLVMGLLAFAPCGALASDTSAVVQSIQQRLQALGYFSGKADGKKSKQTEAAVAQFVADFRLSPPPADDEALAAALEAAPYAPTTPGDIYVLPDQPNSVSFGLQGLSHAQMINHLYELSTKSVSKINTDGQLPKSVVFVLSGNLKPGDIVTTQIEVIHADLPKYFENFYYQIDEKTPVEPLVIVNEVEAGWELYVTHRMLLNGVLVAEKRTRAAK